MRFQFRSLHTVRTSLSGGSQIGGLRPLSAICAQSSTIVRFCAPFYPDLPFLGVLIFLGLQLFFSVSLGLFIGGERGKTSLLFWVVFLGFYLNTKEWKIRVGGIGRRTEQAKAKFDPRVGPTRAPPRAPTRAPKRVDFPLFSLSRTPHESSHVSSAKMSTEGPTSRVRVHLSCFHLFCSLTRNVRCKMTTVIAGNRGQLRTSTLSPICEAPHVDFPKKVSNDLVELCLQLQFYSFSSRLSLIFSDFRFSWELQHIGGVDFRRKPQDTAEFRRKPAGTADFRKKDLLSHLICPY